MNKIAIFLMLSILTNSVINSQSDENHGSIKEHRNKSMQSLHLTEEQKAKMKVIQENRKEAVKKRKEENKEFHKNLNKKTQDEIKQILSPEQRVKFDSIQANRKLMRKEGKMKRFKQNRRHFKDSL